MTTDPNEYHGLIDLLAVFSDAENRLAEIQTQANDSLLETLDDSKRDFATAQLARDQAEEAIKDMARNHPEWADGRTIKTPYGSVRFTATTSLEVANDTVTVSLIRQTYQGRAHQYLHVNVEPNLETLGLLEDDALAKLGIRRVKGDSITIKAAKVDMGKAARAEKAK